MKPHFIVTGANGFLGSNIVDKLLEMNYRVDGLIQAHNDWSRANQNSNLHFMEADITKPEEIERFFAQFANPKTIVIHTAGLVSISSNIEPSLMKVNVKGTKNIVEACQQHEVKRLVYISSVHAIPELPNDQFMTEIDSFDPELVKGGYAKTKAMATQEAINARRSGMDVVVIHPSGIIGPGDLGNGNIKQAIVDYLNRKMTAIVKGGYDFVDVRDVAQATIDASLSPNAKDQNYILSNKYFSMRQIIDIIDEIRPESQHRLDMLPTWFIKIAASLAETWYKLRRVAPTFTRYSVYVLGSNANFDHSKATQQLNYQPRPMKETLRDTIEWYKKQGFIKRK